VAALHGQNALATNGGLCKIDHAYRMPRRWDDEALGHFLEG
jgi:hypothetical protein